MINYYELLNKLTCLKRIYFMFTAVGSVNNALIACNC